VVGKGNAAAIFEVVHCFWHGGRDESSFELHHRITHQLRGAEADAVEAHIDRASVT
jgi:hypothetical protein